MVTTQRVPAFSWLVAVLFFVVLSVFGINVLSVAPQPQPKRLEPT